MGAEQTDRCQKQISETRHCVEQIQAHSMVPIEQSPDRIQRRRGTPRLQVNNDVCIEHQLSLALTAATTEHVALQVHST